MRIFNKDKTQELNFNDIDINKGKLEEDIIIKHIPFSPEIKEQGHYEVIKEYSNGGQDLEYIVDVAGHPMIEEHDEEEKIQIYIPFTIKELNKIKIWELKDKLNDTDYQAIKYAEGQISEEEYLPIKQQRQNWRDEINKLELELKNNKSDF